MEWVVKFHVIKRYGTLAPATEHDAEAIKSLKDGATFAVTVTRPRNVKLHRKFFALLNVGFEAFEPPEQDYRGFPVQKNFDRFRKDVIISSGYYKAVANLNGDVRAEAKSISFAKMSESEFSELYLAVSNVLLQKVLKTYTGAELDAVVEEILAF